MESLDELKEIKKENEELKNSLKNYEKILLQK